MRTAGLSAGLGTLNGTTPVAVRVRRDGLADTHSRDFPNGSQQGALLDRVEVAFSGLPGAGGLSCTLFLTYDAAGDELASNPQTVAIQRGQTTNTDGGATFPAGGYVPKRDGSTNGSLWAWLAMSTGSAVPAVIVRAIWFDEVP